MARRVQPGRTVAAARLDDVRARPWAGGRPDREMSPSRSLAGAAARPVCRGRGARPAVLAMEEKRLGPEHPEVAESLDHLAMLDQDRGRDVDAERSWKRALAICEKSLRRTTPKQSECFGAHCRVTPRVGASRRGENWRRGRGGYGPRPLDLTPGPNVSNGLSPGTPRFASPSTGPPYSSGRGASQKG